MGLLTHDPNAGGVASVQMYIDGRRTHLFNSLENIAEASSLLKALNRTVRKYLETLSSSNLPQPAKFNDNPAAVKLLRGESVAGIMLGLSTFLANCNIKD